MGKNKAFPTYHHQYFLQSLEKRGANSRLERKINRGGNCPPFPNNMLNIMPLITRFGGGKSIINSVALIYKHFSLGGSYCIRNEVTQIIHQPLFHVLSLLSVSSYVMPRQTDSLAASIEARPGRPPLSLLPGPHGDSLFFCVTACCRNHLHAIKYTVPATHRKWL